MDGGVLTGLTKKTFSRCITKYPNKKKNGRLLFAKIV